MNEKIVVNEITYTLHNAYIKSTSLGFEDHGIMTFWLNIEYSGGCGQGVGGYALDDPVTVIGKLDRVGTAKGMDLIMKIIKIVGVSSWEDLPGKYVRVYSNSNGVGAIFNILEDRGLWFKEHFSGDV